MARTSSIPSLGWLSIISCPGECGRRLFLARRLVYRPAHSRVGELAAACHSPGGSPAEAEQNLYGEHHHDHKDQKHQSCHRVDEGNDDRRKGWRYTEVDEVARNY